MKTFESATAFIKATQIKRDKSESQSLIKRFTPKWNSNKMGNAKKGHKKMGCAKVVMR